MRRNGKPYNLPILALNQGVLFPTRAIPLTVVRPSAQKAIEAALASDGKDVAVVLQKNGAEKEPAGGDLYDIGTRAVIKQANRLEDESLEVLLFGLERVQMTDVEKTGRFLTGTFKPLPLGRDNSAEAEALRREIIEMALEVVTFSEPMAAGEIGQVIADLKDNAALVYLLATIAHPDSRNAQDILEAPGMLEAMRLVQNHLSRELQVLKVRRDIAKQAQSEISKEQREYILRQNLRAIREQLGEKNPEEAEANLLRQRVEAADLPEHARKEADRELSRLSQIPSISPEFGVVRAYLEFMLELPWNSLTEETLDIRRARQVLDEDHYGLKDVKERILEHLGVMKLNPGAKSPILCFAGPPGVGKTSVGQSIARAIGRKFERLSLGGLHDEAELRGHRRTYIGSLPGRILQALRRAGTRNPLIMLDEVDKLGRDFRGDPSAALMEILDPEQNFSFRDNYLDLPFDLSKVFFITTANALEAIPQPLLDRMEILRFPGYSNTEKKEIAEKYLLPRQLKHTGLPEDKCRLTPGALEFLISRYTREAGVRQLERAIGSVYRKVALQFAETPEHESVEVLPESLGGYLGPAPFFLESARKQLEPGVAAGMSWTEAGGDIIYIEGALLPGNRGLTLTGQLGSVMQESARAAHTYIWSQAGRLGIAEGPLKHSGIHIHVPAGAIPKDGPSAGVTMAAAMTSLYTKLPCRSDTAMTGEITLSGLVLPVGGLKEKILAAHRAEMKCIVLPKQNEKDLEEIPAHVRNALEFVLVEHIDEALLAVIPGLKEKMAAAIGPSGRVDGQKPAQPASTLT